MEVLPARGPHRLLLRQKYDGEPAIDRASGPMFLGKNRTDDRSVSLGHGQEPSR